MEITAATDVTGIVTEVVRMGHTVNGNPKMAIKLKVTHIEGLPLVSFGNDIATIRISNDAAIVYEIENREFKEIAHTFYLTRAGRISHRKH